MPKKVLENEVTTKGAAPKKEKTPKPSAANILTKLSAIQQEIKVPKTIYNKSGDFYYRSCDQIYQAFRPLGEQYGVLLVLNDSVELVGSEVYVVAEAKIIDIATGEAYSVKGYAREPQNKPKMDSAQCTGTASSYARKYALNGLFCLDDVKDSDSLPPDPVEAKPALVKLPYTMRTDNSSEPAKPRLSPNMLKAASAPTSAPVEKQPAVEAPAVQPSVPASVAKPHVSKKMLGH